MVAFARAVEGRGAAGVPQDAVVDRSRGMA
jgi:hypothetical protein